MVKKQVSSEDLFNYIRTDIKKIEADLKIVKDIILENIKSTTK